MMQAQTSETHGAIQADSTDAEGEALHASDRQAGRIIICLLTAVFASGLALYSYICWSVM